MTNPTIEAARRSGKSLTLIRNIRRLTERDQASNLIYLPKDLYDEAQKQGIDMTNLRKIRPIPLPESPPT